jgi:putative N6-adenine-specific DNA methylase/tRNA (guanine6-N2)-methyltransferase
MTIIRLVTNKGLEDVAAAEFNQKADSLNLRIQAVTIKPWDLEGIVLLQLNDSIERIAKIVPQLRSVYQVIHHLHDFKLDAEQPLVSLQQQLINFDILPLQFAQSFRVTSERYGNHPFNHLKIQQAAGSVLLEKYQTPVSLQAPEFNLRVDLYDLYCLIGIPLHLSQLDRRYSKMYQPKVTLNPTVAYAMLQFLKTHPISNHLLDPFCGSGTILLEAATTLPNWKIYGSDYNAETLAGTEKNIITEQLSDKITLKSVDARALNQAYPAHFFTAIVTNPPYGIRMGKNMNFYHFYRLFLAGATQILKPQGRIIMLVGKKSGEFKRALRQYPEFQLLEFRLIKTGNFYPHLAVLEKQSV